MNNQNTVLTLDQVGAGKAVGIILGTFFGAWLLAATFFLPYFHAKYEPERSLIYELHQLTFFSDSSKRIVA